MKIKKLQLNDISQFELLQGKLKGLYDEILTLSKKNPTDPLNKFKLKLINNVIIEVTAFLKSMGLENPINEFEQLDDDSLPSNSDVVLVLSQYMQCMEKFRADNIKEYHGRWYWVIDEEKPSRLTSLPDKLKK